VGFFQKIASILLSTQPAGVVSTVQKLINSVESEGNKIDKTELLEKVNTDLQAKEIELTEMILSTKSLLMTGWWGILGWICSLSLCFNLLIIPFCNSFFGSNFTQIDSEDSLNIIYLLLGMGTLKSVKPLLLRWLKKAINI